VGKLVDEHEARTSRKGCVDVELVECAIGEDGRLSREHLETGEQRLRLLAAVRFYDADDDIDALHHLGMRGRQHLVGFADAGSAADKDLQTPDTHFPVAAGLREQRLRRGTLLLVLLAV